jgi:hypothetical protein
MSGKSSTEDPSDKLAEIVRLIERENNLYGARKYADAEILQYFGNQLPRLLGDLISRH